MEFSKDYSYDSLDLNDSIRAAETTGAALVDFELTPYSGGSPSVDTGDPLAPNSPQQQEQEAGPQLTKPLEPELKQQQTPKIAPQSSSPQKQQQEQQSPAKQRKTSGPSPTNTPSSSSSSQQSTATTATALATTSLDIMAVKNLLLSSYSQLSHVLLLRKPYETGLIISAGAAIILALTFFSIISVVAYGALGVIVASSIFRVYKTSMVALNRSAGTPIDHIWEKILNYDVSISLERIHELVDASHSNVNASLVYFKQVLLVEDILATLKFGIFLYLLTYIGAWFNGMTVVTIICVVWGIVSCCAQG